MNTIPPNLSSFPNRYARRENTNDHHRIRANIITQEPSTKLARSYKVNMIANKNRRITTKPLNGHPHPFLALGSLASDHHNYFNRHIKKGKLTSRHKLNKAHERYFNNLVNTKDLYSLYPRRRTQHRGYRTYNLRRVYAEYFRKVSFQNQVAHHTNTNKNQPSYRS